MSILMYKQRHRHPNYRKTPKCNYAHIGYIATRPGASKNEGMRHGLFGKLSCSDEITEFETWQEVGRLVRELSYRKITMYRSIISFSPETAAELALNDHQAWEEYVEQHILTLARRNGITDKNLQWAAAHHNERGHPHVHVVFWDKNQQLEKNFVPPKVADGIRIQLIKDTFPEKIQAFLEAKDMAKATLYGITDEAVVEFNKFIKDLNPEEYRRLREQLRNIEDEEVGIQPPAGIMGKSELAALLPRLFALKEKLPKTGRLYYKLLPEDVKAELDAFVAALKGQNAYIGRLVDDYADSKCRLVMLYSSNPDDMDEYRKKAVAEADKLIANKILKVLKTMMNKEHELTSFEYSESQKAYYTEEVFCEILMLLEQAVMALDDEYEEQQKAMGTELSKAAKKEWYLRHKDKGMEM